MQSAHLPAELNLDLRSRWSAVAVWLAFVFLLAVWWSPWAGLGTALSLTVMGLLNADLYRFFWKQGGVFFGMAAAGLHTLYLLYSSLVFALVAGLTTLSRARASLPKGECCN